MKKPEPTSPDLQEQDTEEESFLRRWSRRKLEDEALEAVNTQAEMQTLQSELPLAADVPEEPQPLELTDEDMPPLETLDENSDYSGFLSPKVSETLRRQALRKLFHLPQFNITDGLNDYDDDYTQHEKLGNVVTHEMKRLLKRNAEKQQAGNDESQQPKELLRPTEFESAEPVELADTFDGASVNTKINNAKDTSEDISQEDVVNAVSIDRSSTET